MGWTLVAILSPLILLIAFLCALGSGATEHNITAVELCFYDTIEIPAETPEEYRLCIEAMRASFAQLDIAIAAINENTEEETSLNDIRVKAIFLCSVLRRWKPWGRSVLCGLLCHLGGGHNSQLLARVGQTVEAGDVIALSGSTGRSTGPHLHFGVRINGERTSPRSYLP